jgi:hypothetical protein
MTMLLRGEHALFKGTIQTGRSRVRYPIRSFLNLPDLSGRTRFGVYSASNRKEYQKHKNNNVSGE